MRGRARAALVVLAVSASFGLAGCAAIDELKEAFLRWVEAEKLPAGRGSLGDGLPDATPATPPEKPPKKETGKPPKKQVKSARKPQQPRPQTVVLPPRRPPIPDAAEAARPEGTEGQSAPPAPATPQLPSRFREAPPPGRFSR